MSKENKLDIRKITEEVTPWLRANLCAPEIYCTIDVSGLSTAGLIHFSNGSIVGIKAAYNTEDKITVIGSWPSNKKGEWMRPSDSETVAAGYSDIKVTGTRKVEQIASEIAKRFLPGYTKLYDEMLEKAKGWDEYYAGREATVDEIEAECPTLLDRGKGDRNQFSVPVMKHGFYGGVDVSSPSNIGISLKGLNAEMALKILKAVEALVVK